MGVDQVDGLLSIAGITGRLLLRMLARSVCAVSGLCGPLELLV